MYYATTEIYGNIWGARNREGRLVFSSRSYSAVSDYVATHRGTYLVSVPEYR